MGVIYGTVRTVKTERKVEVAKMTIKTPENCSVILMQFKLPGKLLPGLLGKSYAGIENIGVETPEQEVARKMRSLKYDSRFLNEKAWGDVTNMSGNAHDLDVSHPYLVRATVQERERAAYEIEMKRPDGTTYKKTVPAAPHQFFSFAFVRTLRKGTVPLGLLARIYFESLFLENGWGAIEAYEHKVRKDDVPTGDMKLSVVLSKKQQLRAGHWLGEELIAGVHGVINPKRQKRDDSLVTAEEVRYK